MSDLFPKLEEAIKGSHWDRVVSISEQSEPQQPARPPSSPSSFSSPPHLLPVLSSSPGDAEAEQCLFAALLRLGHYDRVEGHARADPLLKAYCAYKGKRYQDALLLCDPLGPRAARVRAQSLFKLARYEEASVVYASLREAGDLDEELATNLAACYVHSSRPDKALSLLEQHKGAQCDTFELTYNGACAAAAKSDWTLATHLLRSAQSTAEDAGLAADDLEDELAPIRVMLAYVMQQMGGSQDGRKRSEEAQELYKLVVDGKGRDKVATTVASSNLVPLQGKHGLYDALKRLEKGWTSQEYSSLLTLQQRQAVGFNYATVLLRLNKHEQCSKVIQELVREFPDWTLPVVLSSALDTQQGNSAGAITALESVIAKGGAEDGIRRALAQLLHGAGKDAEALKVLGALAHPGPSDVQHMISWAHHGGVSLERHVVDRVANAQERAALLEVCARAKVRQGDFRGAADDFAAALKLDPQLTSALVGFVSAASQFDSAKAELAAEALPTVEGIMDVDVDALEARLIAQTPTAAGPASSAPSLSQESPPLSSSAASTTGLADSQEGAPATTGKQWKKRQASGANASKVSSGAAAGAIQKKKQRKRAPKKLPKDMDKPVDPERWLPMKDRSYYVAPIKKKVKVKGVKARIGGAGGHQGGATAESAAALDMTAKKEASAPASTGGRGASSSSGSGSSAASTPKSPASGKAPGKKKGR